MNLTFEMVAMEDLLDAAVQMWDTLEQRLCVYVCEKRGKRLKAHLQLFINERQSGRGEQ